MLLISALQLHSSEQAGFPKSLREFRKLLGPLETTTDKLVISPVRTSPIEDEMREPEKTAEALANSEAL